jgi:preprotein translocase subunit SecG
MILALWYHNILATLFGLVAVLLIGVILLQRGRGVGLSGAFGGAGGHTAFGAKTGDVLTWATIVIAVVLLTFTVILNYVFVPLPALQVTPSVQAVPTLPADAGTEGAPATDSAQQPAPTPADAPAQTPPPAAEAPAQTPPPAGEKPGGGEPPIWS